MTIVAQFSWDDIASPDFSNPARVAWREAVAEIASKAQATLPEAVNGRIEKAVAIVLNGDVELLADGKAKVASQSNGTTQYVVCNGTCECRDFAKAEGGWCKHRAAAAIHKRASALAKQKLAQLDSASNGQAETPDQPAPAQPHASPATPAPMLPEAPASCNVYVTLAGRKVQVTLRDSDEQRMLARLDALLTRFPAEAEPEGEQAPPECWCGKHGVQMKLRNGEHGSWWSHKTADGWCKGQ